VPRFVALLRGVNVGGRNRLDMAQLRALVASLGASDVTTYIQSGNVVFTGDPEVAAQLRDRIVEQFGLDLVVVLRTAEELAAVVANNPFPRADPATLHVGFMSAPPSEQRLATLDTERFLPATFSLRGRELYLHLPAGMGQTTLPAYLERMLKTPTTARNWRTLLALTALAGELPELG